MNDQLFREAETHCVTVLDWLRLGISLLTEADLYFGHGTDNARDDAAWLVAFALSLPFDDLGTYYPSALLPSERLRVSELFQQRIATRLPVAYITNTAYFAGMSFYVDQRVLVPRSPIAELIETQFSSWIAPESVSSILDLCTGSGCIAIACAHYFPGAFVDAVDLSPDALEVAEINIEGHEMTERVSLIASDLFSNCPEHRYDIIVSNPPYVSESVWENLPDEFQQEPKMGFVAEEDGLLLVKRILSQSRAYLSEHGILVIEVGYNHQGIQDAYPDVPFRFIPFKRGGEGVFIFTASELDQYGFSTVKVN